MDTSIRSLLASAQSYKGVEKNPFLQQAYMQLKSVVETRPAVDAPDPFGQDLFVLSAEIAFQYGHNEIARDCLKMYFMKQQPSNQFLVRAYLCQAQLLAPQHANNPEQLDKAVVYLLKAISMAKKTPRYHFMVYNASVVYWQFCRPFLKPNYRQYLARSLHQVVKALDDIEDTDYEWRAQLMIALIECHMDAGRRTDASHISTAAASFIKANVPHLYKQVFGLMVRNQLVESAKLHKDVKTSPELSVFYKICKLKNSLEQEESREYYMDISAILTQMGVTQSYSSTSQSQERLSRKDSKMSSSRRPPSAQSISPTGDEERNTGGSTSRKSAGKGGRRTPTPTTTKKLTSDSADSDENRERPFLLLELAHLCLDLGFADLASDCVEHMKTCNVKEQGFYLQLEFMQCLLMVKNLGEKQESYQKPVVELRMQAIKRCEEAIMNAIRCGDPNVIQAGCVTQWNLCLPLTQPNLRRQIRKPLTLIAEALEDNQSLLIQLRCQVHTELAKCEEDLEQIQVAMEHLKKALQLDDGSVYQERLEVMLRRLELRSQLYRQPERPEDQAAMIIEQARKADSGTIRMKRSLLVKAGEALAPDAFLLVLDSESDTKAHSEVNEGDASGRGPLTVIKQLGGKARAFNRCVRKAEGHLKRLGDENDRERSRLWADLAKTARKQEVWDVCRVASRFCLLYDDGRWKNVNSKAETPKLGKGGDGKDDDDKEKKASSRLGSRPMTPVEGVPLYDKDLIRMLAEVNFINGEALVHLLRTEGVQLNDKPIPPEDKSKRPKGYVAKKPEEDPDWIEYCDWLGELSADSTKAFLRGMELGVELGEAWLVCSAATYIWNYNNHILSNNRHREIVPALTSLLSGLKKVGHAGETIMLVNICKALAHGLLAPWIPQPPKEEKVEATSAAGGGDKSPRGKPAKQPPAATKGKTTSVSISPDAGPDVKKAIEVCEFAIGVTNGDNAQDVVPIGVRQPLLNTWVTAKQMGQQQISKALGTDDDSNMEGQKPMTRAIVATEMLSMTKNGIMEFKDTPFIGDIAQMVEKSHWSDHFIELQLWTRLTALAFEVGNLHNLVMRCSNKALRFVTHGTQPKARNKDKHQQMVEQEMLSYASVLQGQSLINNMAGKNSMRREAMEAFLNSCRFACSAKNYELVMTAARHYWNAAIPLVSQPIERELLKEPLKIILECINATTDKKVKKEEPPPEEETLPAEEPKEEEETKEDGVDDKKKLPPPKPKQPAGMIGKPSEDLTLRAAMYGVLFQSYADQGEWEQALQAMDQAITDMPRTKHRLLVFKHRVMVKAKLGRSVHMDIQKFKDDESEDYVAHMWRRVALSSKELSEQLSSYQNAIESLNSASNEFQKVEYLLEFGQWLYANEFPLQDVLDQVEWAVDILLNMQDEEALLKKDATKGSTTSMDSKKGGKGAKKVEKKRSKGSARSKTSRSKSPVPDGRTKKVSMDAKSEISDQDSEINAADYVPVVKESVIGVLPNNPNLTINDLMDVQQLDALVRSHVLLAELTGRDGACYADILLQAYGYLLRLWKVLMAEAGTAMKEIAKNQTAQVEVASKGKSSGKGKAGKEKESANPAKEKPKRKGPLEALPDVLEDWAVYDAPDEAVEAFQHEIMKKTGLNEATIPKPMLTLYYLDSLTKQLKELGYTHLTLPVLAFEDVLSRSMLKNHSLNILVHIRALEVCHELDLKTGCEFHETIVGNIRIREEDQAMSRQEIALWKEKQVQVAREEMRVKETLARMTADKREKSASTQPSNKTSKTSEEEATIGHIGVTLGAVSLRVVWTDMAEVLIRLGYLQRAREFLNEANIAAQAFSDNPLRARIMLLLGKLSFEEAQYGQAINFCKQAQEIHEGDEIFWFETSQLLLDSVLLDYSNPRRKTTAKKLLVHALNEFTQITNDRPNRAASLGFIITMLEAKLARVQMESVLQHHQDVNVPKVMRAVLSVCEKVDDAAERLVRLGHRREAIPLIMKHASHLTDLARAATEPNIQHAYYLEALGVLGEAESLAEQVVFDVQTLTIHQEIRGMSLAAHRELCNVQLHRGELLVEVAVVQVNEMRSMQLTEQRKGSIQRLVEDYIRQTPCYTPAQQSWLTNRATVFEEAVTVLLSAHSLAGNMTELRSRALLSLGKCLRILAEHKGPDRPPQWLVHEMEMLRLQQDAEEAEAEEAEKRDKEKDKEEGAAEEGEEGGEGEAAKEEEGEKEMSDEEKRLFMKNSAIINTMAAKHEQSKLYFTYATECLTQALNLTLANKHTAIAGQAALELVKCCAQFDPSAATMFLALYQSCQTSQHLKELLHKAQKDPMTSRLAALLHQRQGLLRDHLSTNLGHSSLFESITQSLDKDWQAWKLLEVLPNHLDLLKEFPSNFNIVILQHSPDKDFLFGAILDKPKAGAGDKGKGGTKMAASATNRAKIFGVETSKKRLQEIVDKFTQHKQSVQTLLLKQEYQRTQAAQRQKMLENLDDNKKPPKAQVEDTMDEEQMLEEEFRELVAAMEQYLNPIMSAMDTTLRSSYSPVGSMANLTKDHKDKDKDKDTNECVILLADADLMEMPLEALSCLQADGISALSRDFSLQFLYHRLHQGMGADSQIDSDAQGKKKGKKEESGKKEDVKVKPKDSTADKKKAKEAAMAMSRIPGARDIKAKQAKIIPLNRPLQPWQQSVDTMMFRYIVDPNLDCAETEERLPVKEFTKTLDEYEQQFTPRWLGVSGEDHVPSVGEWEVYMTESSAFIFYGLERLLSYLPPAKMSALNIPDCMLLYSLDLAQTSKSFMRQSKTDVLKSHQDVALEKPLESAMLVSLTGIRCFITNQWHCSLAENSEKLHMSMKDLLEKGKTTGQTVRLLLSPRKRRDEEKANEVPEEPPAPKEDHSKDGGKHKKDDTSSEKSKKDDHHHSKKGDDAASKADGSTSDKRGSVVESVVTEDVTAGGSEAGDPDKDEEEPKEEDLSVPRRYWFNMVCYGMPNLVITQ